MNNLGCLYLDIEKYKDAENIFLEVIELQDQNLGLNHPRNTKVYCENLIELYN